MGSVLTELILIFSVRTRLLFFKSRRPSTLMLVICGAAVVLTILIPWTSFGQEIFKFTTPTFYYLGLVGLVVITYFTVTEGVKLLYYRFTNHTQE
jgi:magnesium-transporting ATPase (P-type)